MKKKLPIMMVIGIIGRLSPFFGLSRQVNKIVSQAPPDHAPTVKNSLLSVVYDNLLLRQLSNDTPPE